MKLQGRRESTNVEDRRGKSGGRKASLGIGGMIVVGLLMWIMGGNPLDVLQQVGGMGLSDGAETEYVPTEEEQRLFTFSKIIFASTEDVWTDLFAQRGLTYKSPKLVIFHSKTTSGCGNASSVTGPFYCSADQTVYIDLSFFSQMETQLKAGGDFAYAYVIAHEVGHHVQYLLGKLDQVHRQQSRMNQVERNRLNVRLELQADFYAGVWANHENKRFQSIEDKDIADGLNAASQIGDDRLQMEAQGYTVPDAFNHGTSAQRMRWLKKGIQTGNPDDGDTFSPNYSDL